MPVEVIKYTCQFKCGKKAVGERVRMVGHESHCWNNPENQTCKTCKNEIYESDSDGYRQTITRGCKIDTLNEVFENTAAVLSNGNVAHLRPIYHCPYWNNKSDEKTNDFADALKAEILSEAEGTAHYPYYNKPKTILA